MIIYMRSAPQDDHLQEAGPSGWLFARGRPIRMIICKKPNPLDEQQQQPGWQGWPGVTGQKEEKEETLDLKTQTDEGNVVFFVDI